MQPLEVVGLALLGIGFLLSGVGTLRGVVGPASSTAGARVGMAVAYAQQDARRVLAAGAVALFAGLTLING